MRIHDLPSRAIGPLCGTFGAVALAVGVALGSGPAAAQQTYRMKFATQTLNDAQHEYIKVFKREIEKVTQGRIQVGVFPASQLGGAQLFFKDTATAEIYTLTRPGALPI